MPPKGWRWHNFTSPQGRKLRFGSVAPQGSVPDAVVIGLQGLSEFTEKYFEVAHELLGHNLSFWMLDWQGQGKSHRHLRNTHKRHSEGFEQDVLDLHYFIMEYVKHSAVHPDVGRIPLVMLGHSMGANIGLRYLHDYPDMFACAAFTAPLFGVKALSVLPMGWQEDLTSLCAELFDQTYLEVGGGNWNAVQRDNPKKNIYSSDPARSAVHNVWCLHDPALQVGNVTYVWLKHAVQSCAVIRRKDYLKNIKAPCLFALSGHEKLTDNKAATKAIKALPNAETIMLDTARHEILMESDAVRSAFFAAFYDFIKKNNIKERLKPF